MRHPIRAAVKANSRSIAAAALAQVFEGLAAADRALVTAINEQISERELATRDRAYAQALLHAALRCGYVYQEVIRQLVPKKPHALVRALLCVAFADLHQLSTKPFAAVNEAVEATRALGQPQAAGLVNALLRRFKSDHLQLIEQARLGLREARYNLPDWLSKRLQLSYPQQLAEIASAHAEIAPMWLRVHPLAGSAETFVSRFSDAQQPNLFAPLPQALHVHSMPVAELPGFARGEVSVQDGAAQIAAQLLAPKAGERILDACAAPGGKTAHLSALAPTALITAVDVDGDRLERVRETLARVGAVQPNAEPVTLIRADARSGTFLTDASEAFDAILLDAPCSATGVIRRHPDIVFLRRPSDVAENLIHQAQLLDVLWRALKPSGRLLYATCSILPEENQQQISAFMQRTPDAALAAWPESLAFFGSDTGHGRQNLPGQNQMDGFFYALMTKRAA